MNNKKFVFIVFFLLVIPHEVFSADLSLKNEQIVRLWKNAAPGSDNVQLIEKITDVSGDAKNPARVYEQILSPSLTVYIPKKASGAAAVVIPGGGYLSVNYDSEGAETARWLASAGITAFVLKYRLPGEGHLNGKDVPLQDAQRSIRVIRTYSSRWGIDSSRVGVVGVMSGGHLAGLLGSLYSKRVYMPRDDIDESSARPDWMILLSPEISGNVRTMLIKDQPPLKPAERQQLYDAYPAELFVTQKNPRTFIVCATDDVKSDPENSLRFYLSLKRAGVPAEMHIYQKGGVSPYLKDTFSPAKNWTNLCLDWLKESRIIR